MEKKKFYMTTAIAYTSGKPHIGNTYEAILADSIARFKRLQGYEVFLQTGTDEHGQKIEEKAAAKGVTPKAFVDEIAGEIKGIWDLVGTSYDKFIRTTDADHEKQVQKIFKKLYDQGTDGRPDGQRNKIAALGLEALVDDILITDELGGIQFRKPNDIAFRILQTRWAIPCETILYVGDNPAKDFQAPRQLGMQSLFFRNSDGLYSHSSEQNALCDSTADTVSQLQACLLRKIGQ